MPRPHGRRGLLRTLGGLLLAPLVAAPPLDASSSPDADRDRRLSGGTRQTDPFLGEILLVPYNFAPRGWVFCEGQRLPIRAYQALYSLLGTTYGGDGRYNFGLPDLRPVEAAMKRANGGRPAYRHVISLTGAFPSRT